MNYPIWELPSVGGGLLIAIIAIVHAFVAHIAVGGGLYLVLTEMKAYRENDQQLLDYVKRHTFFFLLLTMVFGGVTGVGIWFIIGLVNPAGTSSLIHTFVFGWAIEWVFFIVEIIALLIYYIRFKSMDRKSHLIIGWIYFGAAWMSLFVINGILSYMLTPGGWLETQSFWAGFFNPTFFPSLIYRTGMAMSLAGLFGLITGVFTNNKAFREKVMTYCVKWLYFPFLFIILSAIAYLLTIPDASVINLFSDNNESDVFIRVLLASSGLIFILGLLFILKIPLVFQRIAVFLLIFIGLGWLGGFEYLREIARKPYVIYDYLYSNGIKKSEVDKLKEEGYLNHAKWLEPGKVSLEDQQKAGEVLFTHQCASCHTIGGYNDILERTKDFTKRGLIAQLTGQGKVNVYMPPFAGTKEEKEALASYIFYDLHQNKPQEKEAYKVEEEEVDIPEFNFDEDEYVLLAWNDLGMHCISDNDRYFVFLPPANTLWAMLVRRGPKPQIIEEGVELIYQVQEGFNNPEEHVPFWEFDEKVFGVDLPPKTGLAGKTLNDTMDLHADMNAYVAELIPVTPYRDDKTFNPYPLFTVTAKNKRTGEDLISTKVVAPTSTEMGCRNCHQGGWRWESVSGLADKTAENILAAHDKYNHTNLLEEAHNGNPKLCQSCHGDPALNAPGNPEVLNLSAAVHGFHANYLSGLDEASCNLCHPSAKSGNTWCIRGRHGKNNVRCIDCHGTMEDHALALLKHEYKEGKEQAVALMANLTPRRVTSYSKVKSRVPWLQEPTCTSCHDRFSHPSSGFVPNAYNKWVDAGSQLYRNMHDNHGMMCIACHGAPHAIYDADNKYGSERDNIQPLQYQGVAGTIAAQNNCKVCHIVDMNVSGHHRNMLRFDYPPVEWEYPEDVTAVSIQKAGLIAREAHRPAGGSNIFIVLALAGCGYVFYYFMKRA